MVQLAVCIYLGVKLAGPSSDGSSVEQCRPTYDKGVTGVLISSNCSRIQLLLKRQKKTSQPFVRGFLTIGLQR